MEEGIRRTGDMEREREKEEYGGGGGVHITSFILSQKSLKYPPLLWPPSLFFFSSSCFFRLSSCSLSSTSYPD